MRRLLLVLLGLLVAIAGTVFSQGDLIHDPPPLIIMQERLAYSVDPPRRITVEFSNACILASLMQGWAILWAVMPTSPQSTFATDLADFGGWRGRGGAVDWHGTYPGASYYQFRPGTNAPMEWETFALHLDVPTLAPGTPIGLGAYIIPAASFGRLPVPSEKFAITPAPTVELLAPDSDRVTIAFPTLSLEWIEWSQTARYRAGNIVLYSNVHWRWDDTNPNAIYIDNFHIDLASGVVSVIQWWPASGPKEPTLLPVIIDDSDSGSVYWEDLWW